MLKEQRNKFSKSAPPKCLPFLFPPPGLSVPSSPPDYGGEEGILVPPDIIEKTECNKMDEGRMDRWMDGWMDKIRIFISRETESLPPRLMSMKIGEEGKKDYSRNNSCDNSISMKIIF